MGHNSTPGRQNCEIQRLLKKLFIQKSNLAMYPGSKYVIVTGFRHFLAAELINLLR